MSIIETLLQQHPVRKSKAQKAAFRDWFTGWAKEQGYTAQVESGWNLATCHNIVVGDPENAEVTYTAHYDTQPVMVLPIRIRRRVRRRPRRPFRRRPRPRCLRLNRSRDM